MEKLVLIEFLKECDPKIIIKHLNSFDLNKDEKKITIFLDAIKLSNIMYKSAELFEKYYKLKSILLEKNSKELESTNA